ncbi:MAG: hypothetical protein AB7T06_45585, partial [Kofleriaceae bacterium]
MKHGGEMACDRFARRARAPQHAEWTVVIVEDECAGVADRRERALESANQDLVRRWAARVRRVLVTVIEDDSSGHARCCAVFVHAHADAGSRDLEARTFVKGDVFFERRDRAVDVAAMTIELDDVCRGALDRA